MRGPHSLDIEFGAVVVLDIFQIRPMVLNGRDVLLFFLVLVLPKRLLPFKILDSLGGTLLIFPELVDSALNLRLLIFHALGQQNGVHHLIRGTLS